jgi:hypothetical protein
VPGLVADLAAMADGRLRRLFWRVVDHLDYLVTLAWLRVLDALAGPLPVTPADRQRRRDRERDKKRVPRDQALRFLGAAISRGADRVTSDN